jgi:hypothetical protein
MGFETIEIERSGGLAHLRLNRPERYNALNGKMMQEELPAAWQQLKEGSKTARITHQIAPDRRELVRLKGKLARVALVLPSWWEHHREGATGYVLGAPDGRLVHPFDYVAIRRTLLERAKLHRPGLGYHIDREEVLPVGTVTHMSKTF